jgi:hypothetical protein
MVSLRLDRPALASVHMATLPAAPGKLGQCEDFLMEGMIDRNSQRTIAIHLGHLPEEVGSVVGASLGQVILPLMDHFMRQRARDFLFAIGRLCEGLREERQREPNLPITRSVHSPALLGHAWADSRDK